METTGLIVAIAVVVILAVWFAFHAALENRSLKALRQIL